MLSSLTSFLPSRLQGAASKDLPRPAVIPDEQSDDEPEPRTLLSQPESKPGKSKDRDGKGPSETFVFVRPPPSISNHPLNLQVQLVPPNSKLPTGIPSTPNSAASTFSNGTSLRRTASNHSQTSSSTFNNSSTTSFASFTSSTTSSGSRRAIIPLYNLQAHNVMTNVIVDAGTDAKIAKFQKRGIELIDLAFLEPVEVWGEKDSRSKDPEVEKRVRTESMRLSVDAAGVADLSVGGSLQEGALRFMKRSTGSLAQSGSGTGLVAVSATPSAISLGSQPTTTHGGSLGEHTSQQDSRYLRPSNSRASVRSDTKGPLSSSPITPTSDQPSSPTPKKNIFGKLFNKKSGVISSPPSSSITPANISHSSKQTEGLPSFASFSILQSPRVQSPKQVPEESDESLLQTPTAGNKERNQHHGRNLSLTGITAPIKSTLKNNRNRLSGLVNGMSPSSNPNSLGGLGIRVEGAPRASLSTEKGRDASPNPSVASRARSRLSEFGTSMTTQSTDSLPADHSLKDADVTIIATTPTQLQTYPLVITPSHPEGTRQPQQPQPQLRPPVLGCQPTFVSSAVSLPPTLSAVTSPLVAALSPRMNSEKDVESFLQGQRALMYVWLVRKWLKKRVSTILGGEATAAGIVGGLFVKRKEASTSGQDTSGPPPLVYGGVEVRFEWKRAKGKEAKGGRGGRRSRMPSGVGSIADIGADSDGEVEPTSRSADPAGRVKREVRRKYRMSAGSFMTVSDENGLSLPSSPGGRQMRRDEDDGYESDPEDSETPWVCTLKVRRSASAAANGLAASTTGGRISPVPPTPTTTPGVIPLEPQVLRVKVGTLSPTPHHPKVVAMLKVPFPLPDVEVERMGVVKRDVRSMGFRSKSIGEDGDVGETEPYVGYTLTAEEIKDVVCTTGLWLVVREGFGGVGKVPRKGDGWRIRS